MLSTNFLSRDSVAYYFFFCSVLALMLNSFLTEILYDSGWNFKNQLRFFSVILASISFLISGSRLKLNSILLVLICTVYSLLTLNQDLISFIFILIVVIAGGNLGNKRFLDACFIASFIIIFLIFLFLLMGVTEQYVREFRNRATFGLNGIGGPTLFFNYFFGVSSLAILKYRPNILLMTFIAAFAWYFFLMTDVRGGAASITIFLLLLTVFKSFVSNRFMKFFIAILPIIFLMIAFSIPIFFNNSVGNFLLSNRPFLIASLFDDLTFFDYIFGTSIKEYDYIGIIDNSFLHLFIGLGAVVFTIVCVFFYQSISTHHRNKNILALAFMISTACYASMESILVRPENAFILYFWYLVFIKLVPIKSSKAIN